MIAILPTVLVIDDEVRSQEALRKDRTDPIISAPALDNLLSHQLICPIN